MKRRTHTTVMNFRGLGVLVGLMLGASLIVGFFAPGLRPPRDHPVAQIAAVAAMLVLCFVAAGWSRAALPYYVVGIAFAFMFRDGFTDQGMEFRWRVANGESWRKVEAEMMRADFWRAIVAMLACRLAASARWRIQDYWPWRPHPPDICHRCGYNLTGNVSGRCPECGTDLPVTE